MTTPSLQDIFDRAINHLIAQGQPATDSQGSCYYRTDTGLACAVGALIPDDVYHKFDTEDETEDGYHNYLEAASVSNKHVLAALKMANVVPPDVTHAIDWKTDNKTYSLLERLQLAHDGLATPYRRGNHDSEWFRANIRNSAVNIALQFNLSTKNIR